MGNTTSSKVDNNKRSSILKLRTQSNRSIAGLSQLALPATSSTTEITSESSPNISSPLDAHRHQHDTHKNSQSLLKRLKHYKPLQHSENVQRSTTHRRDLSSSTSSTLPVPQFSRSYSSLHLYRSPSTASATLHPSTATTSITTTTNISSNSSPLTINTEYPYNQNYIDYDQSKRNKSLAGPYYDNQPISSTSTLDSNTTTVATSTTTYNTYTNEKNRNLNTTIVAFDKDAKEIINATIDDYSSELMLKELYMLYETSPERRRDRDRRHRQHYLMKRTWGKNYKIPLNNPSLIIDWCCATAVWDLELAFEFPKACIVGIDHESVTVSSLTNTVKNFSFQNAMIHQGETGLERFEDNQVDYLMMRDVWLVNTPALKWKSLFREIYRILKPGGYIEIYEQDVNFRSIGPHFTLLETWSDRFYEAIQFDRDTNNKLGGYLQDAGFVNVVEESIELPVGEWPESKEMKETGFLIKDIIERRYREIKRWYCRFNNLTEKEYATTLLNAIDECDHYNTTVRSLYYSAQKSP